MLNQIKSPADLKSLTPEQIQQDLEPLGYKEKDFKKISGKQVKLLVPGKERKVVADKIAKSRVQAGVHYPSDIAAGKAIAEQMIKM
jgi:hypothetical protein